MDALVQCSNCYDDNDQPDHPHCATCQGAAEFDVRYPSCVVQLVGMDGNAYSIMGRMQRALRDHMRNDLGYGRDRIASEVQAYIDESKSGDYDNLLRTAMRWAKVL
jgi:hypothetical protein